jgi:protein TonB
VDERKSWKWIILAYAGAAAALAAVTFFFIRGASHGDVAIVNGYATATPTVVNVYNGIRPEAESPWIHAKPEAATASPSPTPFASGTPGTHPSGPASKALAGTLNPAALPKHIAAGHAGRVLAASETGGGVVSRPTDNPNAVPPAEVAQVTKATDAPGNPAPEPTQAPTAAPVAPAPATPAAPSQDSVPIYAPERIVDAQVRNAAQPDFPDADRERGEHGTSVVLVTIDPKGNVVSTSVSSSSGYPALDRAAIAAARESQFIAPKINGHPATETYRLVYDFTP